MPPYLTREQLYAYVWTYPLGKLSRKIGVPMNTIRDACETMAITLPELSYWMALRLGKTPDRPAMPPHNGKNIYSLGAPVDQASYDRPSGPRHDGLLSAEDLIVLTGRKNKSSQREALRSMGILFAENAMGHPVVPISSIEGPARQARQDVRALEQTMANAMRSFR